MTEPFAIVFGKLPRHGDFVSRGLAEGPRQAWDDWASQGLAEARERLGENFEPAHDIAPPWRFITGPGPFGQDWRAGALAPSVDSAGRRFVILVAADGLSPVQAKDRGPAVAEDMEGLIYSAFSNGWNVDELTQAAAARLSSLSQPVRVDVEPQWWTEGSEEQPPRRVPGQPANLLARMLEPVGAEMSR